MFLYKLCLIVIKLHNNSSIIYLIYSFDLQMRNHTHDAYMSWIRIVTYFSRIYSFENPAKQMFFFFFFITFESSFPQCRRSIFNENPFPLKIHRRTAKIDWFSLF